MKIAIIGTRGIPNHYGGFEQFAEHLSKNLVEYGLDVTVYNSHTHPFKENIWNGVKIIHCKDPENKIGTIGQFIYDLNCIRNSRKQNFDIILQLGYTSSTVWGWLLPRKKSIITTNMDGLEYKRSKYSKPVQQFLKYAEKLAIKYSDFLISDSVAIQEYLKNKYQKDSVFIPYGATFFDEPSEDVLEKYNVEKYSYNILIARLEPENNIETILDGTLAQIKPHFFLVIGNSDTKYGSFLKKKYAQSDHIRFLNDIYNQDDLNNLRYYSNIYFHGHSVGGTNPSLLEAMGSQALICAHDNIFNRFVLKNDGFYFSNKKDISTILNSVLKKNKEEFIEENLQKIKKIYSWDLIIHEYLEHFQKIFEQRKNENL